MADRPVESTVSAAEPIIHNPIGWAQARLIGGPRRILAFCGLYALGVVLILALMYRGLRTDDRLTLSAFCGGALSFVLVAQTAILFIGGMAAIKKAVLRDFTTDMISSHRLTAMSGATAVLGYLTGPTALILALTAVNWLLGTVLALLADPTVARSAPTLVGVMAMCMVLVWWTFAVLIGLSTRGATSITALMSIMLVLAYHRVLYLIPGLAFLLQADLLQSVTAPAAIATKGLWTILAMCAQLVLALVLFTAASRKYTRDDVPAFSPTLGYCLLAFCSLLGGVGWANWPMVPQLFRISGPRSFFDDTFGHVNIQLIATLIVLALVALLPIATTARAAAAWSKRRAREPGLAVKPSQWVLVAPILATLIGCGVFFAIIAGEVRADFRFRIQEHVTVGLPRPVWTHYALDDLPRLATVIAGAMLLALTTAAGLLRAWYRVSPKAMWMLVLYVVLLWAIPPFADMSLEAVTDRHASAERSLLFTLSPVGVWIATLMNLKAPVLAGLGTQAGIAVAAIALASRSRK